MGNIDIEHIEFILNTLKEVADKVTINELEYYVLPSVVLDKTVENLRNAMGAGKKQSNDG